MNREEIHNSKNVFSGVKSLIQCISDALVSGCVLSTSAWDQTLLGLFSQGKKQLGDYLITMMKTKVVHPSDLSSCARTRRDTRKRIFLLKPLFSYQPNTATSWRNRARLKDSL